MLRLLNRYAWLLLLAAGLEGAFAFSLLGPINEAYQDQQLYYNLPGDLGAPKNLAEEYRRNMPVLYYSFDQNFIDYFGSNGIYAVEQAFAIMNGLTNVSSYSSDLSEFPMEAQRYNYRAQALTLSDLKSATLTLLAEQMGLAEPDRFTWTLHDRYLPPGGTCPQNMIYLVIKRNFDPVTSTLDQLQASSYVNGALYSYYIIENCSGTPYLSDAVEFPVDPLANTFTAVAAVGILDGVFYTGFTRDDVAGLRYLLRTNNMNIESAGPNTLTITTNLNSLQLLVTSNLTQFAWDARTNDAAALAALYPGLIITGTSNYFENVVTTNLFAYFTNFPWSPAGSPASLVIVTNRSTNVGTFFQHSFANVITNQFFSNGCYSAVETRVEPAPWGPPGTLATNVTTRTVCTKLPVGEFWIVPTNSCDVGYSIVSTQLVQVLTNIVTSLEATNAFAATNVNGQQITHSQIYYFTNHIYVVRPIVCQANTVALRQGIERIRFVRRDYDSLLGQFFSPATNEYILNSITNNTLIPQRVQRLVTQPDILLTADDLTAGPNAPPAVPWMARNIQFSSNNAAYPGLAGPGTIEPSTVFTYNKVGPVYYNVAPYFLDEVSAQVVLIWGSFDGSTNLPVVYPNGTSVVNLENQVLIQVTPTSLPDGSVGAPYSAQFQATGGQAPYTWSLAQGSAGLPPGLSLSPAGAITGTPIMDGVFDFAVRLTDAGTRFVDRPYTITINP